MSLTYSIHKYAAIETSSDAPSFLIVFHPTKLACSFRGYINSCCTSQHLSPSAPVCHHHHPNSSLYLSPRTSYSLQRASNTRRRHVRHRRKLSPTARIPPHGLWFAPPMLPELSTLSVENLLTRCRLMVSWTPMLLPLPL